MNIRDDAAYLNTHAYFLRYLKKFLFPTLYWKEEYENQFEKFSNKKGLDITSRLTCVNFDYMLDKDKGVNYKFNSTEINFKLSRIELTCFQPGICFLIFKTELDCKDGVYSNNILDFNYKFRTINPRYLKKK